LGRPLSKVSTPLSSPSTYRDKEPFDWYQRYSGLKDVVTQYIQPTFQILNIGCGNSSNPSSIHSHFLIGLSEEMYEDGYQHITNIDISFTVVKQMQELYKEKLPNLPFK
jgi:peptidyl-tRNA hydrolase